VINRQLLIVINVRPGVWENCFSRALISSTGSRPMQDCFTTYYGAIVSAFLPPLEKTDHQAFQLVADGVGFGPPDMSLRSVLGQTTSTRVHAIAVL
jgi:hypothetical protein